MTSLERFIAAAFDVLLELAPWLLLGLVVAGAMVVLVPPGWVSRTFRGPWGVVRAVALGVPLPLCSCGVIPAGLGLKRQGASDGATVGFLISTPQTGVDSLFVTHGFLGWPFAIFKLVSAAAMGLVGGLLTHATQRDATEDNGANSKLGPEPDRSLRGAVAHAMAVLDAIAGWLVVGILVSAAITTFMPREALSGLGAPGTALAYLIVLAIAVPLYVCATASVPIASALVGAGFPTGAALVFLMAGPATNAATFGAVYRGLGRRPFAIYLGTILVGSLGLGIAFDSLIPVTTPACCTHGAEGTVAVSPWQIGMGGVLVVLLLRTPIAALTRLVTRTLRSRERAAPTIVGVDGMSCGGCVATLETRLAAVPGVRSVEVVRTPDGRATVTGTASTDAIRTAIRDAGFTPR